MNWGAIRLSIELALVTVAALLVLGTPLAYWLAYSRRRWKFLVEAVVALPLILPPTVLGYYLLVSLGPESPLGALYLSLTGETLPFTFQGLVVGSVLFSFPFAVQPLVAAFAAVPRPLIEASWTLGASRMATFWRVILPQSRAGLWTAIVLSFAHTVGEFGVVLMLGGGIEGVTKTVSIAIYEDVQMMAYAEAGRTSLLLLGFSFVVLATVYGLNRRAWPLWPAQAR